MVSNQIKCWYHEQDSRLHCIWCCGHSSGLACRRSISFIFGRDWRAFLKNLSTPLPLYNLSTAYGSLDPINKEILILIYTFGCIPKRFESALTKILRHIKPLIFGNDDPLSLTHHTPWRKPRRSVQGNREWSITPRSTPAYNSHRHSASDHRINGHSVWIGYLPSQFAASFFSSSSYSLISPCAWEMSSRFNKMKWNKTFI
jgi:hypothetical protein